MWVLINIFTAVAGVFALSVIGYVIYDIIKGDKDK
jgi:hypothetical protein